MCGDSPAEGRARCAGLTFTWQETGSDAARPVSGPQGSSLSLASRGRWHCCPGPLALALTHSLSRPVWPFTSPYVDFQGSFLPPTARFGTRLVWAAAPVPSGQATQPEDSTHEVFLTSRFTHSQKSAMRRGVDRIVQLYSVMTYVITMILPAGT